jgi:hypothetical protein
MIIPFLPTCLSSNTDTFSSIVSSTFSFVVLQPPPAALYCFAAHAFAYADGYTSNFFLACV